MNLAKLTKKYYMTPIFLRNIGYIQGQEPEPKVREYFYYIDHQGMLFLDDSKMKNFTSCFKDKKFLQFFFNRLKKNTTNRYEEFPYISLCGKEKNFVRCDDYPIVYTSLTSKLNKEGISENHLSYNHAAELLTVKFLPEKIFMLPENGRVYYPAPERAGSIGLNGEQHPPTHFRWKGQTHTLDNTWYSQIPKRQQKYNPKMYEIHANDRGKKLFFSP